MEYIGARELSSALLGASKPDLKIVDVRGIDEFLEGHIEGAVNISSDKFLDDEFIDNLVNEFSCEKVLVFHCQMSQQRGPTCARRFSSRLSLVNSESKPKV
jgi:Cdc25 family phosphatase